MNKTILPRQFIRVAASNELTSAENALDYVDAFMISQPFVCKMGTSIAAYLQKYKKPFLFDPETYRYFFPAKRHLKNKKPRLWLKEMSLMMPEEIKNSFGQRKASLTNFDGSSIIEFCQANLEIQTSLKGQDGNPLLPLAIMCPYAMIDNVEISKKTMFHIQIVNTMNKINKTGLPVVATIYLARELLSNPVRLNNIAESFNVSHCLGVAVWIDNFDEATADDIELENLKDFYLKLSESKHVLAHYAGIAQILMMYSGINSITHGIHYQMMKNGVSEGGGPAHYFYLPNIRQRIRTIDAAAIVARQAFNRQEYLTAICNCPICYSEISHNPKDAILALEGNTSEQVSRLITHFAHNKRLEIHNIRYLSKEQYAEWLLTGSRQLDLTDDELVYVETIERWISAILNIHTEEFCSESV
ncbi:hypothetical protein GTO89_05070 [Heliobacterium gestii]|uniref:Uncharacterized protein n=1 Tax=Heliomicrobium gestii TaxID=2699 RepID=A0A845L717_HELGE|nr:hypothetical protein [Heliomicrobium gestii]MBM7866990.1 hypothetical protein [Heliomicrobium gestii]MZP42412.1 hypothetical protein [Heliomicrobium gestii]